MLLGMLGVLFGSALAQDDVSSATVELSVEAAPTPLIRESVMQVGIPRARDVPATDGTALYNTWVLVDPSRGTVCYVVQFATNVGIDCIEGSQSPTR